MFSENSNQIQNNLLKLGNNSFYIHKKFNSKKNQVYLASNTINPNSEYCVIKIFNDEFKQNLNTEVNALELLASFSIPVPRVLAQHTEHIILEYLEGKTILQVINEKYENKKFDEKLKTIFKKLAAWLALLHAKTRDKDGLVLLKGDCVLKNFILEKQTSTIYGLDFEESSRGGIEIDLGNICAATLAIKPEFTKQNFELCKLILDSYNLSVSEMRGVKSKTVREFKELLKSSIFYSTADALTFAANWCSKNSAQKLVTWAKRIRETRSFDLSKYL